MILFFVHTLLSLKYAQNSLGGEFACLKLKLKAGWQREKVVGKIRGD